MDDNERIIMRRRIIQMKDLYQRFRFNGQFDLEGWRSAMPRQWFEALRTIVSNAQLKQHYLQDPKDLIGEVSWVYTWRYSDFIRLNTTLESQLRNWNQPDRGGWSEEGIEKAMVKSLTARRALPERSRALALLWLEVPEWDHQFFTSNRWCPDLYPEKHWQLKTRWEYGQYEPWRFGYDEVFAFIETVIDECECDL